MSEKRKQFWSTTGVAIIIFLGAVALLIGSLIWRNVKMNSLADYSATITYENGETVEYTVADIEEYENSSVEEQGESVSNYDWDEMVRQAATGVSTIRKNSDDNLMDEMLRVALTWDSKESYTEARDTVIEKYGLSESDQFLQEYLPPVESYYLYDGSGALISDAWADNANMKFVSLNSHVSAVTSDGTYSYVTDIMVQGSGSLGGTSTGHILAEYDIDANSHIFNMKAYSVF